MAPLLVLAWKWVQPIVEVFEENSIPLHIEEDGFTWWLDKPAAKEVVLQS